MKNSHSSHSAYDVGRSLSRTKIELVLYSLITCDGTISVESTGKLRVWVCYHEVCMINWPHSRCWRMQLNHTLRFRDAWTAFIVLGIWRAFTEALARDGLEAVAKATSLQVKITFNFDQFPYLGDVATWTWMDVFSHWVLTDGARTQFAIARYLIHSNTLGLLTFTCFNTGFKYINKLRAFSALMKP